MTGRETKRVWHERSDPSTSGSDAHVAGECAVEGDGRQWCGMRAVYVLYAVLLCISNIQLARQERFFALLFLRTVGAPLKQRGMCKLYCKMPRHKPTLPVEIPIRLRKSRPV